MPLFNALTEMVGFGTPNGWTMMAQFAGFIVIYYGIKPFFDRRMKSVSQQVDLLRQLVSNGHRAREDHAINNRLLQMIARRYSTTISPHQGWLVWKAVLEETKATYIHKLVALRKQAEAGGNMASAIERMQTRIQEFTTTCYQQAHQTLAQFEVVDAGSLSNFLDHSIQDELNKFAYQFIIGHVGYDEMVDGIGNFWQRLHSHYTAKIAEARSSGAVNMDLFQDIDPDEEPA